MLGERSEQRGLWEADRLYLDHVGRESFYGLLASLRGQLFRDSDFAEFYCADNGRDSVPPSLLATALLLQSHDKVSDAEAKARADFDLRWKVALGIEVEDRPFAKSTLQVFRAQLILHDQVGEVFESSLRLARESGYLKRRGMRVALDTTNLLGRGARAGHLQPVGRRDRQTAAGAGPVEGESTWDNGRRVRDTTDTTDTWAPASRAKRPSTGPTGGRGRPCWLKIVGDADRLLELSRQAQGELGEESAERQGIVAAAELLGQLLLQDVARTDDGVGLGVSLKDGVSRDRMLSVHDPELRHGRQEQQQTLRRAPGGDWGGHRFPADHRRGGIARQRAGQLGGAGPGGGERSQHRCDGGRDHGRCRLWRRRYQAGLRRRGTHPDCPSAGAPESVSLPQGRLSD